MQWHFNFTTIWSANKLINISSGLHYRKVFNRPKWIYVSIPLKICATKMKKIVTTLAKTDIYWIYLIYKNCIE